MGPGGSRRLKALLAASLAANGALGFLLVAPRFERKGLRETVLAAVDLGRELGGRQNLRSYRAKLGFFELLPIRQGDIVMLGDSLMEEAPWGELLPGFQVRNRGISGDTIKTLGLRLQETIAAGPKRVFLMIGTNDLLEGSSAAAAAQALSGLVSRIRAEAPSTELILLGLPPVNHALYGGSLRNDQIREYNERIEKVAAERGARFVSLYEPLAAPGGEGLDPELTRDGIHLNARGYLKWKERILPYVQGR